MNSRGFPSMTALLGLLAIAGYQNRDKIAEMIKELSGQGQPGQGQIGGPGNTTSAQTQNGSQSGGASGGLGGLLGGATAGGLLSGGLGELLNQLSQNGQKDKVDSWVGTGANSDIAPTDLKQALGPEVLQTLSRATGLSEQDLLARLSNVLPGAVDKYTPDGRVAST
jgi:uncharacterized protein YidB (DUF937 family)